MRRIGPVPVFAGTRVLSFTVVPVSRKTVEVIFRKDNLFREPD